MAQFCWSLTLIINNQFFKVAVLGSGVTEATCKTLVTQRMKCAGMRWNIEGGQRVLTARSLMQSELIDNGWDVLAKTYIEKIKLPENVIPFRKNKRIMMLTVTNRSTPDWDAIFQVLVYPHLPLTNNEAEQALRHWVILRSICHGTRTEDGTRILAILVSFIETCRVPEVALDLFGSGNTSKTCGVFCTGASFS